MLSGIEIGFERTEYSASEGEEVEICAVLTMGTLKTNVTVSVTSSDVTANGNNINVNTIEDLKFTQYFVSFILSTVTSDYVAVSQVLVFNTTASKVCFPTSSWEDGILEDNEVYRLTLSQIPIELGVTINPSEATFTIVDNDSEYSTLHN